LRHHKSQATYPGTARVARYQLRNVPLFGLAPSGVCPAIDVATNAVRSYRTISPLPDYSGGIFSVALSVDSHLPGVTWHFTLWSPDFPPGFNPWRLSSRLRE